MIYLRGMSGSVSAASLALDHTVSVLTARPPAHPCRRVNEEDITKCEDRYNKSKLVHSIMRHVAETTGKDLEVGGVSRHSHASHAWPLWTGQEARTNSASVAWELGSGALAPSCWRGMSRIFGRTTCQWWL